MLLQQRNLLIERVNLLQKDIVNYQELVKAKNGEINRLDAEIALDSNIVSTYKSKIATYDLKIASYNRDIEAMRDTYAKEIKKQRRKTTWSQVGGLLITGGLGYLLLVK